MNRFLILLAILLVIQTTAAMDLQAANHIDTAQNVITVGPRDADVVGADNRAIQLAIDALSLRGGGTVRVLPGEYTLIDALPRCFPQRVRP